MSVPAVIIDAANVAATTKRPWPFSRVVEVRDAWLSHRPGSAAMAVLDASVRPWLGGQKSVDQAVREEWLEVHVGDADDRILALADQFGAAIISRDNFRFARREFPWLQEDDGRVMSVRRMNGRIMFSPRRLVAVTDEEIERDWQRKREKAGLLRQGAGDRYRHASEDSDCIYSDAVRVVGQINWDHGRAFCLHCSHEVVEIVAEPPQLVREPDTVRVTISHGIEHRGTILVPESGVVLGRASRSRPDVTDVTEGLNAASAADISRAQLRIFFDDDGEPLVEHLSAKSASFLNPELDFAGLPGSARLATGEPYALEDGDELHLGPATVRLRIHVGSGE